MSFFKDFKEDLSQAVNELMPEENSTANVTKSRDDEPQMVDTISDNSAFNKDDIADLLNMIDPVPVMDEPVVEEPIKAAEPVVETVKIFEPEVAKEVQTPVYEEVRVPLEPITPNPATIARPVQAEPVAPAPAPVQPVAPAPAQPVAPAPAPVQVPTQTVAPTPVVQTYVEPEPVAPRMPVAPVFAPQTAERPAPINTTMEDFSMETGLVIAGMTVTGDIKAEGNLEVRGSVAGNLDVLGKLEVTGSIQGNSKAEEVFADGAQINGEIRANGTVKIGQSTVVKGNISASSAVLAGAVKGDIDVQGPVILDATAIIMGNIKSKSIQINNGAVIEGLCSQCYADVSPMSFFGDDSMKAKAAK